MDHMTKPTTTDEAIAFVRDNGVKHVRLGIVDVDGVMRGKYVSASKFISAAEKGHAFCDVVLGRDSNDQLYDNVEITG